MNKSQAIREMLNEKKVRHEDWSLNEYVYFPYTQGFRSQHGDKLDMNDYPKEGWEFFNEPEKIELPTGFKDGHIRDIESISGTEVRMLMVEINQIIRYLKSKE